MTALGSVSTPDTSPTLILLPESPRPSFFSDAHAEGMHVPSLCRGHRLPQVSMGSTWERTGLLSR